MKERLLLAHQFADAECRSPTTYDNRIAPSMLPSGQVEVRQGDHHDDLAGAGRVQRLVRSSVTQYREQDVVERCRKDASSRTTILLPWWDRDNVSR